MITKTTTTDDIASNVQHAAQGIQDVNENVVHGAGVASTISRDIVEVTRASEEVSSGSSRVYESAANLSALAEDLNAKLAQFRI